MGEWADRIVKMAEELEAFCDPENLARLRAIEPEFRDISDEDMREAQAYRLMHPRDKKR